MKKYLLLSFACLLFVCCFSCKRSGQAVLANRDTSPKGSKQNRLVPTILTADTIFKKNAPVSMTRKISLDQGGNLILAAYQDVIRYDGKSFQKILHPKDLDSFDAFDAYEDKSGHLWIASTHVGVFRYDSTSYARFTSEEGLSSDRVMCIFVESGGNIWLGTQAGISYYDGQSFRNFTTEDGLSHNNVNTIFEDQAGKIWMGNRGTLCVYDPTKALRQGEIVFEVFTSDSGQTFENVWAILEDEQGHIWLGGQYGLWKVNGGSSVLISDVSVTGAYADKNGTIWLTHRTDHSYRAGLSRINSYASVGIPIVELVFIGDGMFFGLAEDREGSIWVGTLNGVFRYDGAAINYFKEE